MDFFYKLKDFINYHKVTLIGFIILLIIVLVSNFGIYAIVSNKVSNVSEKQKSVSFEKSVEVEEKETEKQYYQFDIKGNVNKPGVYSLEKGSRVIEKTTTNMIQKISPIFAVNPLISKEI